MTKKLICLLLAAFLGVSLIALLAACRGDSDTQEPSAQSTTRTQDSTDPALPDTTDVFSLEVPTEHAEE